MTTATKTSERGARETRVQKRVEEQHPNAGVDEDAASSEKSRNQQRRESRLEIGRPKDSGRCGA